MKSIVRSALAASAVALALSATPAAAFDVVGAASAAAGKFSRGLTNAASGSLELYKNLNNEISGAGVLGVPMGLIKGVGHSVGRTVAGAIDLATFPVPSASPVQPACVLSSMGTETSYGTK